MPWTSTLSTFAEREFASGGLGKRAFNHSRDRALYLISRADMDFLGFCLSSGRDSSTSALSIGPAWDLGFERHGTWLSLIHSQPFFFISPEFYYCTVQSLPVSRCLWWLLSLHSGCFLLVGIGHDLRAVTMGSTAERDVWIGVKLLKVRSLRQTSGFVSMELRVWTTARFN